jgi:hypothetical protein
MEKTEEWLLLDHLLPQVGLRVPVDQPAGGARRQEEESQERMDVSVLYIYISVHCNIYVEY